MGRQPSGLSVGPATLVKGAAAKVSEWSSKVREGGVIPRGKSDSKKENGFPKRALRLIERAGAVVGVVTVGSKLIRRITSNNGSTGTSRARSSSSKKSRASSRSPSSSRTKSRKRSSSAKSTTRSRRSSPTNRKSTGSEAGSQ